jgi:hypothetical protein
VAWRRDLEGIASAELEGRFEEAYVARLVPGARLDSLQISGRDEPDEPLVLRYVFEVEALGRRAGTRWAVPGMFPTSLAASYARMPERTTTQMVSAPQDLDVTIHLDTPGDEAPPGPQPVQLRGPHGASFTARSRDEGDTLVLERQVRVPMMRVTPAEYGQFAQFARAVDQAEAREIPVPLR